MIITVLGGDGAGKSSIIKLLKPYLWERNKGKGGVYRLKLPNYENKSGQVIQMFQSGLLKLTDPYAIASLYAINRLEDYDRIIENSSAGNIMLTDRYVHCNIAYQCARLDDKEEALRLKGWIMQLEYEKHKIPPANISIYLDVPPTIARKRMLARPGNMDINDTNLILQTKVRNEYNKLEPYHHIKPTYFSETIITVITCEEKDDGTIYEKTPQEIYNEIVYYLDMMEFK